MSTRFIVAVLLSVTSIGPVWPQNPSHPSDLFVAEKGNYHCGYINRDGKFIIPARFGACEQFSEGKALVRERSALWRLADFFDMGDTLSTWGYIDSTGKYVLKLKDKRYGMGRKFSEGLAPVASSDDWKWGLIDSTGREVVSPRFAVAPQFSEGFAAVYLQTTQKPKVSSVNSKAAQLPPADWFYIDHSGKIVIAGPFQTARAFHNGLAPVRSDGKWGYIDSKGKWIIPPRFESANDFSEGLAAVELNGLIGYVNVEGSIVIPASYFAGAPFSEGLAAVAMKKTPVSSTNPKKQFQRLAWGYIDRLGITVLDAGFSDAKPFSEGLAPIALDENIQIPRSNGSRENIVHRTYRFIDKSGRVVIGGPFDDAQIFNNGLALVRFSWKSTGYVDPSGKIVWKRPD